MPDHKIFPHGELREVAANLWQLRGSLPFPLPRNMTVHRLPDGELLLHSVVALDDDGMKKLESLGKPAWMSCRTRCTRWTRRFTSSAIRASA
jgi:hypothetical protein